MKKLIFSQAVVIGLFIAGAIFLPKPVNAQYWGCTSHHTVGCDDDACDRGAAQKACVAQCDSCGWVTSGECGNGCPCQWPYMEDCAPRPTATPIPTASPTPTPTPIPLTPTPTPRPPDCLNPVQNAPLTKVPLDSPSVRIVFQGPGSNYVAPPAGVSCYNNTSDPEYSYYNVGEWVMVNWQATFNMSNIESVFAKYNSDYFEGEFQDTSLNHQQVNLLNLNSSQWNDYNGPAQKLTPKIIFNQEFNPSDELSGMKIKYIRYVLDPLKALREDVSFIYTDIYGADPATISQLNTRYGFPQPPTATSTQAQQDQWRNTWGRYWDKIPLAKNDKTLGTLIVRAANLHDFPVQDEDLDYVSEKHICFICPPRIPGTLAFPDSAFAEGCYNIIVPEYFRTNLTSAHLNRLLLPPGGLQSPFTDQAPSFTTGQGYSTNSCRTSPPSPSPSPYPTRSPPKVKSPVLLASSQPKLFAANSSQPEGELLAFDIIGAFKDAVHYVSTCLGLIPGDPNIGEDYCLPISGAGPLPLNDRGSITVNSKPKNRGTPSEQPGNNEIFVCAQRICVQTPQPIPPASCDPSVDPWWPSGIFTCPSPSCIPGGGATEYAYQCECTAIGCSYVFKYTQDNPCCNVPAETCHREPGRQEVDIPFYLEMEIPYLESIWNKVTSYRDNDRKTGFEAFFAPSLVTNADSGVILNREPFERAGKTPIANNMYNYVGGVNVAQFILPTSQSAYPDFISGVANSTDWVRSTLWPPGGAPATPLTTICTTPQQCGAYPSISWHTECAPNCSSPNRICHDTPSCTVPPPNCNSVGGDVYCQVLPGGGCGNASLYPTCNGQGFCGADGACYFRCWCP